MTSVRRLSVACGAVVLGMLPAWSTADELSYGVDAGMGYDDNVTRTSTDEQSDTIATIGAQLRLDHESRRLKAKIASRLEYHDYLDNTYDSDVVGNFIGTSTFDLVSERFTWALDDTFGQTTVDQFAANTPANRENINVFSTGPDIKLPLGSTRNSLVIGGRYTDVNYEDSNLGNNRVEGEVSLQRNLSAASVVSLNAKTEQVKFDDENQYPDFDRNEYYLGYTLNVSRTDLTLEGGQTQIRSDGQDNDDWLGRFKISRKASAALTVGAELGHEFADSGNTFVREQAQQPGSTDPVYVQQIATPFVNEYVEVYANYVRNRTDLDLRVGFHDETYDTLPLYDRRRLSFDLGVQRTVSPNLVAHVNANYSRSDYPKLDRQFSDLTATIGVNWQIGRLTSIDMNYTFVDRSDDGAPDYSSNQIWIRIGYLVGEGVGSGLSQGL